MINGVTNSFLNWIYGQLVTAPQMNLLSQDIYNKIGALTDITFPCIISGGNATISGGNVNITTSFCRTANQSPVFIPATNIQGFMNVPAASIAVIPNYYVVAVLDISPSVSAQVTYSFTGTYQLIQDLSSPYYDDTKMVVIGQIDATGTFIKFKYRSKDYGNLLNIIALQNNTYVDYDYNILPTDTTVISTSTMNITYTMPNYKSLGQNYQVTIQNLSLSAHNLTINGNGININGLPTILLYPYNTVTLTYSPIINQWVIVSNPPTTPVIPHGSQTFMVNGTFTPLTSTIWVTAIGGGGGGAGGYHPGSAFNTGGGGGSGDYIIKQAYNVTIGVPIAITIGNGGIGGVAGTFASLGTVGGNTSIGSLITLSGGNPGGSVAHGNMTPGAGGGIYGSPGQQGLSISQTAALTGWVGGIGGIGIFGGLGNSNSSTGTDTSANSKFGSGGCGGYVLDVGGSISVAAGRNGGSGFVLIEY